MNKEKAASSKKTGGTSEKSSKKAVSSKKENTKRTRRRFIVVAVFLVIAGVAYGKRHAFSGDPYVFKKESSEVLRLLGGDKKDLSKLYESSSIALQESRLFTSFLDHAERLTQTLGTFERIERVLEIERLTSISGKTVRIQYQLLFADHVRTRGELSFVFDKKKQWRLLGYNIDIPQHLVAKATLLKAEPKRLKAPPQVHALLRSILKQCSQGASATVYTQASAPFRASSSNQQFKKMLSNLELAMGSYQHMLEETQLTRE